MKNITINFEESNGFVFGSRERAELMRKELDLDNFDNNDDSMTFSFHKDTYTISRSFLLGLIGNSIYRLGDEKFRKKYIFKMDKIHQDTLEDCIRVVMNKY